MVRGVEEEWGVGNGGGVRDNPNLHPARFIKLFSVNDFELSVVKATPRISIA